MKLLLITSDNCGSCHKLKNAMDYAGIIKFFEIKNVNPADSVDMEFIKQYNITTLPTILAIDDEDEELNRLTGLQPLWKIRELIPDDWYEEEEAPEPDIVKHYIEDNM